MHIRDNHLRWLAQSKTCQGSLMNLGKDSGKVLCLFTATSNFHDKVEGMPFLHKGG